MLNFIDLESDLALSLGNEGNFSEFVQLFTDFRPSWVEYWFKRTESGYHEISILVVNPGVELSLHSPSDSHIRITCDEV